MARAIPGDAGTADAVLLLGHLPPYRFQRAPKGAARGTPVLRAGGILLAVAISRFASALDGIGRGLIRDSKFVEIMEQDLTSGQHRNETGNLDYFTTAFFHPPDEFRAELVDAGFPNTTLRAIKGQFWTAREPSSDGQRDALTAVMRTLESDASLIGARAHIMGTATKSS